MNRTAYLRFRRNFRAIRPLSLLWLAGLPVWGIPANNLPLPDQQPTSSEMVGIDDLHAGQTGVVWTVFEGNKPEPFTVSVTGVIRNALGPGKSLILCQLTDPRVQNMGAVAGMSGSPLYIDGKLAGALSYQIQKFETVRYAGFTPIADLVEVSHFEKGDRRVPQINGFIPLQRDSANAKSKSSAPASPRSNGDFDGFTALTPRFALGGIAPAVASLFDGRFQELGLSVSAVGGYTSAPAASAQELEKHPPLAPGSAVAVALATGDVTLAGTGTVSRVDGNHILAFGHPLMGLGDVDLPMASADIIAILPSSLNSFKISNTGAVVGTISQDRLSAIYGEVGRAPEMLPVEVTTPHRTLHFSSVRHARLTPMIAALGLSQAVLGSNDNGLAEGFRVSSTVTYPDGQTLTTDSVFAGPQGFAAGLDGFVRRLSASLQNPIAEVFPKAIAFAVEPLAHNPLASLDQFQVSRSQISPGQTLTVTLHLRDFQGEPTQETVEIPISADWLGRKLEIIVTDGDDLDRLAGRPTVVSVAQIRSFDAYLDLLREQRHVDGLYVAVVDRASAFLDQTTSTLDYPGSVERIARTSDEARFQKREVVVPLWEKHILAGKLIDATVRHNLQVVE